MSRHIPRLWGGRAGRGIPRHNPPAVPLGRVEAHRAAGESSSGIPLRNAAVCADRRLPRLFVPLLAPPCAARLLVEGGMTCLRIPVYERSVATDGMRGAARSRHPGYAATLSPGSAAVAGPCPLHFAQA